MAAGSGVVIDAAKGIIVTNYHVIENADDITVTFADGRSPRDA
jgi:S1-C subfamily serine protease